MAEAEIPNINTWKTLTKDRQHLVLTEDREGTWKGPFYFIQGSDPQLGFIRRELEKNEDEPGWDREMELITNTIERINIMRPKPKFFAVCGDLCDALPTDNKELRKEQEADFKKAFLTLDPEIPLVLCPGGHDICDYPTKETLMSYWSSFGDDYYSFWCGGVFCMVLNSQYYDHNTHVRTLAAEHDMWIDIQLRKLQTHGCKHAVIFQHTPWFLQNPNETKTTSLSISAGVRKLMLEKFKKAGILKIFCGHCHRNYGGFDENLEVVTTSAIGGQLGKDESGIRVVKVYDENIQHRYYPIKSIPTKIDLTRESIVAK